MQYEMIFSLLVFAIEVFVLGGLIRMILRGNRSMVLVFFTFAMASLFLSYLYWIAFSAIRPDERLVFAANEISEWALFLMYGTSLSYMFAGSKPLGIGGFAIVFLSCAANTALWIGWSGEWMQDIVTGLCICYLAMWLGRGLLATKAMSRRHWIALFCFFTVAVGTQAVSFLAGAPVATLYLVSFLALVTLLVILYIRTITLLRKANSAEDYQKVFCAALLLILLTSLGLYMSEGVYYEILNASVGIAYILAYVPLRKGAATE